MPHVYHIDIVWITLVESIYMYIASYSQGHHIGTEIKLAVFLTSIPYNVNDFGSQSHIYEEIGDYTISQLKPRLVN